MVVVPENLEYIDYHADLGVRIQWLADQMGNPKAPRVKP